MCEINYLNARDKQKYKEERDEALAEIEKYKKQEKELEDELYELRKYKEEYDKLSVLYEELEEDYANDMGDLEEELEQFKKS